MVKCQPHRAGKPNEINANLLYLYWMQRVTVRWLGSTAGQSAGSQIVTSSISLFVLLLRRSGRAQHGRNDLQTRVTLCHESEDGAGATECMNSARGCRRLHVWRKTDVNHEREEESDGAEKVRARKYAAETRVRACK